METHLSSRWIAREFRKNKKIREFSERIAKLPNSLNSIMLVLLLLVGEVAALDVVNIVTYGLQDCCAYIGVTTQEAG